MHVIEPERYAARPKPRRGRWYLLLAITGLIVIGLVVNYLRPLPTPTISVQMHVPTAASPVLNWPASGQAAVAADGYGILGTNGTQQSPLATASITKVILALCVLQKQSIPSGNGQTYTISATDVAIYDGYAAQGGSLVPVELGEQLTEYQALQALMLPSANNIADSLANWVFGSQAAYANYATTWLQQHGLDNTHIGADASGFDPRTTSTASDLTQLGLLAAQDPVLMEIAGQGTADLPVAGTVWNYDTVRGQSGIDGLKTGNNQQDPGAFLFTARIAVGGQNLRLSGAVMGAQDLNTALQESVQLAASAEAGFEQASVVKAGQQIGTMRTAWGASAPIVATKSVQLTRWKATPITERNSIDSSVHSGTIGALKATAGPDSTSTSLHLTHTLAGPTFWWRLTRHPE